MNWRGRPLTSFETVLNLISSTTTTAGLSVEAQLDDNKYPTGIKVTAAQMRMIEIERNKFHAEWNYTIKPKPILDL